MHFIHQTCAIKKTHTIIDLSISLLLILITVQVKAADKLELKSAGEAKIGIASTQTIVGSKAYADQTRYIEVINFDEPCKFNKKIFNFEKDTAVRFLIKNKTNHTLQLSFSKQGNAPYLLENNAPLFEQNSISKHYLLDIKPKSQQKFNWFLNKSVAFYWVCRTLAPEKQVQTGIKAWFSKTEKIETYIGYATISVNDAKIAQPKNISKKEPKKTNLAQPDLFKQ